MNTEIETNSPARTVSGKLVVMAMFGFAFTAIITLFVYWEAYTRPFRALQNAIAAEFPGSSPRAIGGKAKSHKNDGPPILRIVARVPIADFNPLEENLQCEERALRLIALAQQHHGLDGYGFAEIHLIQRIPEKATRQWSVSRNIDIWRSMLADPEVALKEAEASPAETKTVENDET